MEYPEHEKLSAVSDESQAVGEFIVWLSDERGILLAERQGFEFLPISASIQSLLSEFFEIDMKKIEAEKRQMLEELKEGN